MPFFKRDDWNPLNPQSTKTDKIKINKDILGNQYIIDSDVSPGVYEFLKEEYESFGSWCETITEDREPGWYTIRLVDEWNFEHTECDVDVILTKIEETN